MPIEFTTAFFYGVITNVFLTWIVAVTVFVLLVVLWGAFNFEKITRLQERKIDLTGGRFNNVVNFCSELIKLNAPFMALIVALSVTFIRIVWNILMIFVALWLGLVLFV